MNIARHTETPSPQNAPSVGFEANPPFTAQPASSDTDHHADLARPAGSDQHRDDSPLSTGTTPRPSITRHIEALSLRELSHRREALSLVLNQESIPFNQEAHDDTINYTFSSGPEPEFLFTAHYDNFTGSLGANDNMAAVCIMIDLYHFLMSKGLPADFALLDGEERGHSGAKLYVSSHDINKFKGVIVSDLCGYGDSIVLCQRGRSFGFTHSGLLRRHDARLMRYLPEDDSIIFRRYHIPALSISIVPKWDVQYLRALASFGERLLGMPPEFDMIISQMEISQTIHNGSKDNPEFISSESMMRVYSYLAEAMTTKETHQNFIRRLFHV